MIWIFLSYTTICIGRSLLVMSHVKVDFLPPEPKSEGSENGFKDGEFRNKVVPCCLAVTSL